MSLELTTEASGKVMIVHASGRLTLGEGTNAVRDLVRELARSGPRRVLLDMAGLPTSTAPVSGS